jgi:hypothetical protein
LTENQPKKKKKATKTVVFLWMVCAFVLFLVWWENVQWRRLCVVVANVKRCRKDKSRRPIVCIELYCACMYVGRRRRREREDRRIRSVGAGAPFIATPLNRRS